MTQETDRELLELAAKAAGIELDYTIRPDGKAFYHSERNALASVDGGWFAPLTDDGDALRLAVKLGVDVCIDTPQEKDAHTHVIGFINASSDVVDAIEYHGDPYAATRRAIVRAAAEIGKAM